MQTNVFLLLLCAFWTDNKLPVKASYPKPQFQHEVRILTKRSPDKESGLFGIMEDNNNQEEFKRPNETVGFLPLPPGYNKLVIPLGNVSTSIFIMLHLSIREVLDVDTKTGIIELDTELGITWIDWEIWKYFTSDKEAQDKAKVGPEEIILDAEFLKSIWKPDIFIEEMASVEKTFLLSKLMTLRFLVRNEVMPGAITFKSRQTFRLRCDMDFHFYPGDTQKCQFNIRSYTYSQEQLFLVWNPNQKIFLDQTDDSNYDFQVSDVEPGEELYELFTTSQAMCCTPQNFSTLTFTLELRRNLTYHFVQTCLPSILLILVTWLCFLLPQDMVEARIGISMTTLLTITAMFASVREQAPEVSYPMAIDIWMVFCILFIFIALVLFTVIYWLKRRLDKITVSPTDLNLESFDPSTQTITKITKTKAYTKFLKHSKRTAFTIFAIVFIIFLLTFAIWLLIISGYYNWSPSPKYNAVQSEDDLTSNRIFTKQETKFKATSTKKIVESQFRFRDIFKQIIVPKLHELSQQDDAHKEEYEYEDDQVETTTEKE